MSNALDAVIKAIQQEMAHIDAQQTQLQSDSGSWDSLRKASEPVMDFRTGYRPATWLNNTQLNPMQEQEFQSWAQQRSLQLGRNVMNDLGDYDLRADFLAGKGLDPVTKHGSDIGKKPNHPTFSTGSKYSHLGQLGGRWTDDPGTLNGLPVAGHFVPSPGMFADEARMNQLLAYMHNAEAPTKDRAGSLFLSPYIARPPVALPP